MNPHDQPESQANEFARQSQMKSHSILGEYLYLLKRTKKWWLGPLLAIFALFGVIMMLASTPAAPFIYTLF